MSNCGAKYDGWCIVTGQDFRQIFFVKDPTLPKIPNPDYDPDYPQSDNNRKEIYQPKDLTGYAAKMDVRAGEDRASDLLVSLETGSGITIIGVEGSVEVFIDNNVTNSDPILSAADTEAFYDIFLIPPVVTDDVQRIFGGEIKIKGSTTNV